MTQNAFLRVLRAYAALTHAKRTSYAPAVNALIMSYVESHVTPETSEDEVIRLVYDTHAIVDREYAPNDRAFRVETMEMDEQAQAIFDNR